MPTAKLVPAKPIRNPHPRSDRYDDVKLTPRAAIRHPINKTPKTIRPPNLSAIIPIGIRPTEPNRTGTAISSEVCNADRPYISRKRGASDPTSPHTAKLIANPAVDRTSALFDLGPQPVPPLAGSYEWSDKLSLRYGSCPGKTGSLSRLDMKIRRNKPVKPSAIAMSTNPIIAEAPTAGKIIT